MNETGRIVAPPLRNPRRPAGRAFAGWRLRPASPIMWGHDPAPSSARPRRPCLSGRRVVVRLPRLLPVDPAGPEVQLSRRPPADGGGQAFFHQNAAVRPRGRGRHQADPSRDHLRQDRGFVPARHLSALQGPPARAAGRSRAAVSADARDRARLRHDSGRAGPLRGRRPDRDLCAPGARGGRGRFHRLGRQGPDAARRAGGRHVRPGLGRPRGAQVRPGGSHGVFRRRAGQGRRHPGARRRFDRQRARRARHRRQDGGAADRRIWRPRNAARARWRNQAAEAARGADQSRHRQAHPRLEGTRDARPQRAGRDAARGAGDAQARRQAADRLPEGDGAQRDHPPRRRNVRPRRWLDRA